MQVKAQLSLSANVELTEKETEMLAYLAGFNQDQLVTVILKCTTKWTEDEWKQLMNSLRRPLEQARDRHVKMRDHVEANAW